MAWRASKQRVAKDEVEAPRPTSLGARGHRTTRCVLRGIAPRIFPRLRVFWILRWFCVTADLR